MARSLLTAAESESEEEEAVPELEHPLPSALDDYEIEAEIAHGGMGIIYRAYQRRLKRVVALKLLLLGRFSSPEGIRRFMREAESAARLNHPNIVQIHEFGFCREQHFFSMDYIEGQSLAELVRTGPLPARRAVEYCRQIADAIDHAHRQGILHRDLKPSNVMIDRLDRPQITDFGLAKPLLDQAGPTLTGEVLGSPAYLSPEQAAGENRKLGPASDIYSIGVMLYELLTGRPPFLAVSVTAILVQIRESLPVPPRLLNPALSRDLESICLRCLEKEPARRYATAGQLAEDLGRFLRGEPTLARPVGLVGRTCRWVQRKPAMAAAFAAIGLLLVTLATFGVMLVVQARQTRRIAKAAHTELNNRLHEYQWQKAETLLAQDQVADSLSWYARLLRARPQDQVLANRLVSLLTTRAFPLPVSPPLRHEGPVTTVQFSDQGDRLLTASLDGSVRLWDGNSGDLVRRWVGGPMARGELSASGRLVLGTQTDGLTRLWEVADPSVQHEFSVLPGTPSLAGFAPDESAFTVATGPRTLEQWLLPHRQLTGRRELPAALTALAWSPDSRLIAVGTEEGGIHWWSVRAESAAEPPLEVGSAITALSFTRNSQTLLAGTRDGTVWFYALGSGEPPQRLDSHAAPVTFLRGSPLGDDVLVNWFGDWPERRSLSDRARRGVFQRADEDIVLDGRWSPDGKRVLLGLRSGTMMLRDTQSLLPVQEPGDHDGPVTQVAFSPDGRRVATGSQDGTARLWDVGAETLPPAGHTIAGKPVRELVVQGDRLLLTCIAREEVTLVDALAGDQTFPAVRHKQPVAAAALSPDGQILATAPMDRTVQLWSGKTGQSLAEPLLHPADVFALAWSPDGRLIATGTRSDLIFRWQADTRASLGFTMLPTDEAATPKFSPDGRSLAVICRDASVRLLDSETGQELIPPVRHQGKIWTVDFSPDGRRFITASTDRTARVWDALTGKALIPALRHEQSVLVARFSPDGQTVATGSEDKTVRLWDASSGRPRVRPLPHPSRVWIVCFSPDGKRLLTAADKDQAQVWDVETGLPLEEPMFHGTGSDQIILRGWFLPDGQGVVTVTHGRRLRHWHRYSVPGPAPRWLPDLVEGLAGRSLNDRGELVSIPSNRLKDLAREVSSPQPEEFYRRWARWFLIERSQGGATPFNP